MSGTPPNSPNLTATGKCSWLSWFTVQRLSLIVILLASALAMSPNVADPDLWGHVQFGRDVLATGEIAPTTSYSFTAEGFRWINHENLSEIIMALVADSLGPLGLVLGKFLLSLLVIIAVLRWNLKQGTGLIVAAIMTLLVAANLGYHWSMRPQLSSFVCFTLMLLLLQYSFSGWRDRWHWPVPRKWFLNSALLPEGESRRAGSRPDEGVALDGLKQLDLASIDSTQSTTSASTNAISIRDALGYDSSRIRLLWLAPLLFLIWANSHGGFVAGLCVYVACLGFRALEALFRGGRLNPKNAGWGIARRMLLMALVAILATLINPYGPRLHLWLLESLGSPRPEISDWSNSELFTMVGMKLWLLVGVTTFAIIASRRRLDLTQLIILFLLLWQSISHFRHVPFFALAAGFWIGPHLQSAMSRFSAAQDTHEEPNDFVLRLVRGGLAVAIVVAGFSLSQRLTDLQVNRAQYPVDAIAFMREHNLYGRLVVTYDWAQYSIAAFCSPHYSEGELSSVAFDGRFRTCYPQSVVDMHFDFLYGHAPHIARWRSPDSPPIDPGRVLQHMEPELVLLRRFGESTEQHMNGHSDRWVLLYQDAIAQVWGARRLYDDPASNLYIAPEDRIRHNRLATDSVTWPAIRPAAASTDSRGPAIKLADSR